MDLGARSESPVVRARVERGRRYYTQLWASAPYSTGQRETFAVTVLDRSRSAAIESDVYQLTGVHERLAPAFLNAVASGGLALTSAPGEASYRLTVPHSFYLRDYWLPFDIDTALALALARNVLVALACLGAAHYLQR